MKKIIGFIAVFSSFFCLSAIAQETFTLTTYYPAPFGVYNELRSRRMAIGDHYYQSSAYSWLVPPPAGAAPIPQAASLVVEGNVGIGTINATQPLRVASNKDDYLGQIFADATGNNDAVIGLGTSTIGQDAAIFMDKNDADKLKIAVGDTTNDTTRAAATKMTITQDGKVGIGTTNPQTTLEIANGYVMFPSRNADPANSEFASGKPTIGMMFYSRQAKNLRIYNGTEWTNVGGGAKVQSGLFTGTGGWTTVTIGFRPKIVMLLPHGEGPEPHSDNLIIKMDAWPTSGVFGTKSFGAYPGCGTCYWTAEYIKDTEGYDNPRCPSNAACNAWIAYGIHITDTGFETNVNTSGRPYSWIAIGY